MRAALFTLLLLASTAAGALSLTVLDVGEGQALLLHEGRRGILIDTGHPGKAAQVVRRLSSVGVEQLDYLVLTHLHPDHAGGYFRIRESFPDTPLLYSGHPLPPDVQPDLVRWLDRSIAEDGHWRRFVAGDSIRWQGGSLEALWPTSFSGANLNRHSLVLLLRYGDLRLLFMGDADSVVERELMARGALPDRVDLLVAGHHGAADASSEPFIAAIEPAIAVISVNRENIRGYPDRRVVERLQRPGTRLVRTDRDGELRFRLRCGGGAGGAACRGGCCIEIDPGEAGARR